MLWQLMNFLNNHQFVDMVEWAREIEKNLPTVKDQDLTKIILPLAHQEFEQLKTNLKELTYSKIKNQIYALLLDQLQNKERIIKDQWEFVPRFQKDRPWMNLIMNSDIIILQPEESDLDGSDSHPSIKDFERILKNPEIILVDGKVFRMQGLSSLENFHQILKDTPMHSDFVKFKKYEKIITFIDALELPLQQLFSLNQIGVIIYQNDIYLIKWFQYLEEKQLLSGITTRNSNIAILEDFGVKIGVKLKENLELGDLVVFRNRSDKESTSDLRPLLSLDETLFSHKQSSHDKKYNLTILEDCKEFVSDILGRIEMGILLLSKERSTVVQHPKDLDIYIKVSLQRVDGIDSVNNRISILRDLSNINQNPDLAQKIIGKLEENYIYLLKELCEAKDFGVIPGTIRAIANFHLFEQNASIYIQTLVYLFDRYPVDADIILTSVDILSNNWNLTPDLILLLEKPQITAISKKVIDRMNRAKFNDVITYLTDFIENHPNFRSYNILTILLQIITNIFRVAQLESNPNFTKLHFLHFLEEFCLLLNQSTKKMESVDIIDIKNQIQATFTLLSQDADFIAFLNDKITNYMIQLRQMNTIFIPEKVHYQILQNILNISPLVIFHHKTPEIGYQIFHFLVTEKTDINQIIQYITTFTNFFTQSYSIFQSNPQFFKDTTKILLEFRSWIDQQTVAKQLFSPLKKEINSLFTQWYLSGHIPQSDFELHYQLLNQWVDFVGLENQLATMIDVLSIKDLLWVAESYDLKKFKKKYEGLSIRISNKNRDLLLQEFKRFMNQPFKNHSQFIVFHSILQIIEFDYTKLEIKTSECFTFHQIFCHYLEQGLIDTIQQGKTEQFLAIMDELGVDLIYLPPSLLQSLSLHFTEIFEYEPTEGTRFNARLNMMNVTLSHIQQIITQYTDIQNIKNSKGCFGSKITPLPILNEYITQIRDNTYKIFKKTREWLIHVSEGNYLTYDLVFFQVKTLILTVISQFKGEGNQIMNDLYDLIEIFFKSQKMLNDNKKTFFKIMIDILPQKDYAMFYPKLQEYKDFVEALGDIESLYYTIKNTSQDREKIEVIIKKSKKMTQTFPNQFAPWYFYGTCLAIQEKYQEAINAYQMALKCEYTQGHYVRIIHNLIVAYITIKNNDKAIEIIRNLDLVTKTYPHVNKLIREIQQRTGQHLIDVE